MSTPDIFLFGLARAAVLSLAAVAILWFVLRRFRHLAPSIHRGAWFAVLVLGLCVLPFSVGRTAATHLRTAS